MDAQETAENVLEAAFMVLTAPKSVCNDARLVGDELTCNCDGWFLRPTLTLEKSTKRKQVNPRGQERDEDYT